MITNAMITRWRNSRRWSMTDMRPSGLAARLRRKLGRRSFMASRPLRLAYPTPAELYLAGVCRERRPGLLAHRFCEPLRRQHLNMAGRAQGERAHPGRIGHPHAHLPPPVDFDGFRLGRVVVGHP